MNTARLNEVMADKDLKTILETVVRTRGIWKSYELAMFHQNEQTADLIYFNEIDPKDMAFAPNVYNMGQKIFNAQLEDRHRELWDAIVEKEGQGRKLSDDEMHDLKVAVRCSDQWKQFFRLSKVILNQRLNAFCIKELPHTVEYVAYIREKARPEAERLAKEHDMAGESDEWLKLSVAVATGDRKTADRLSLSLSKRHKPKKGKAKKARDLLTAAKTRLARRLGLA